MGALSKRREVQRLRRADDDVWRGEFVVRRSDFDFLNVRRDVARKISDFDRIELRRAARFVGGVRGKCRPPLDEPRRRGIQARPFFSSDGARPRAPILLRPVEIAAARFDPYAPAIGGAFEREPAPLREKAGVKYVGFD